MTKTALASAMLALWLLPSVASPKAGRASKAAKSPNHCPTIATWTVSPLRTSAAGGVISVAVTVDDADADDHVEFLWTAASGHFAAARAAKTEYRCESPGTQSLSIKVTDDGSPPCSAERTFVVTCVKGAAGASR